MGIDARSTVRRSGVHVVETFKVLVVDDELGIRVGVERVLRRFTVPVPDVGIEINFDITQAESAEEALQIIETSPPHICLLDNKLPGLSGLDVLDRMAPMNLEMLTIMITAYASIETAVRATKQGAYDFLPKPFTPSDLKNTVRKATIHLVVTRQAKLLAAEKRKVRFQFISVLAHELKAPINAIEGYVRIIRDKSAGDDVILYDELLDRCITRTEYMRKMINDLLDLTRIESGTKPREIQELDLAEVARTAMETAAPDAEPRKIQIELHTDGPVAFQGDRAELEIVMNNLISNAVKYNRDGGRIDITLRRENGEAEISVTDTGIGMTKEECAKLFNDFVRIKNAKTRNILGSGLGLSTLKKLAQAYDGDVSVTSEPDAGSTFTVRLKDATPEKSVTLAADPSAPSS
jgi:two-component system, sensor histidine kinase and response regulator